MIYDLKIEGINQELLNDYLPLSYYEYYAID